MIDEIAFKKWLQGVMEGSGKRIANSGIFLSLYTENIEREPQCALELGIAIMLDKPIVLLVPEGRKLPENMKRLARHVEIYDPRDPGSIKRATERLAKAVEEIP